MSDDVHPEMACYAPANDTRPRRFNMLVWAFCGAALLLGVYLTLAVLWLRGAL